MAQTPPRPPPPPVHGPPGPIPPPIDPGAAEKAIETVKAALPYMVAAPITRQGPRGELCIDLVLLYHGFALDRVHYDPALRIPSPKGRPACAWSVDPRRVEEEARSLAQDLPRELWVVEAVEYRAPERAWVVPLAWRSFIVAHVRVTSDGSELVPDYGLTEEVRLRIE